MRRHVSALMVFGLLALVGVSGAVAGGSATPQSLWGIAIEAPGAAALNAGGDGAVNSVSCPTARNCAAGGYYLDESGYYQATVADETNGSWNDAIEVPGTALLNKGGLASITSVSCPTPGNCAAGGYYNDHSVRQQAFVVDETNGVWGNAIEVPGTAILNTDGIAGVTSVACPTAGNCTAGGHYQDGVSGFAKAFVVEETNGSWGTAMEVPGVETLSNGGTGWVNSVSCTAPGDCTAGGYIHDGISGVAQAWVADETNGSWGDAIEVPGSAALNVDGLAAVRSVSCSSPGNCTAGGYYKEASSHDQAFVADETNGTWGDAIEVPGIAATSTGGPSSIRSLSCVANGSCTAAGYYTDGSGATQAFVADKTNGSWGSAIEVPGTMSLNGGGNARVTTVSCVTAGNCAAGGFYTGGFGDGEAFVVDEVNGSWDEATGVPGAEALNQGGDAGVNSVSCGAAGECTAGGFYDDRYDGHNAFVAGSFAVPVELVGLNGVSVKTSKGTIDSFDSSAGPYGPSNNGSAALVMSNGALDLAGVSLSGSAASTQGAVTVASTASVSGDVTAGTTASIAGPVGGTVTQNSPSTALSWPTVPACSPYSSSFGRHTSSFSYSPVTGNLKVKTGTFKLAGGTYCLNNITVAKGAKLSVTAPVTLHLTGKLTATKGQILNKSTIPGNLEIDSTYAGTGGLALAGGSHAYMTIIAPLTTVTLSSGPFFGKLLAGTVTLSGSASFHADTY